MNDQPSTAAPTLWSEVRERAQEFLWPTDGSDPVRRLLLIGITAILLSIVLVLGITVYTVARGTKAPRTQAERQIMTLDVLTKTSPKDEKIWGDYASVLIDTRQYALAEDMIERGLKATGSHPLLMVRQARLYRERGQQKEALAQIDKAVAAARKMRRTEDEAMVAKGIKVVRQPNAEVIDAEVLRAEIYEEMLRWQDAAKAYTAALDEDRTMSDVFTARALVYLKLKQPDKAKDDLEAALRMSPDYEEALEALQELKKGSTK